MLSTLLIFILHAALAQEEKDQVGYLVEKSLVHITDQKSLEENTSFFNVGKAEETLVLRSNAGLGSLINFKKDVGVEDWAVEFKVKNMILRDIEKAGVYLWYLDKPLEKGAYKGGSPKFNGFLTGIEFSKDRADIAFAFNYGLDFNSKEMQTIRYDHINPLLIEGLDEFKVKIIHTAKNFKVEIYDNMNSLLSDSFRIKEPLIMNQNVKERVFALTTVYEHCPNDVFFDLKELSISSREEKETYDVGHFHTDHNQYPRNKSDEELRLTVANIDHFLNYLTIVLGTKNKNTLIEMTVEVKKKLRVLKDSVDAIFGGSIVRHVDEGTESHALDQKISELLLNGQELEKKVDEITKRLRKNIGKGKSHFSSTLRWIIGGTVVLLVLSGVRVFAGRVYTQLKLSKKDK